MDQDCFPKLCLSVTAPEFRIKDKKSSAGSNLLLMVATTEPCDHGQEVLGRSNLFKVLFISRLDN